MKFPAALFFSGLLVVPGLRSETVTITGFVTSAASRSDFDVNAFPVRCGNQTETTAYAGRRSRIHGCPLNIPYVGEQVRISGSFDKKDRALTAKEIDFAEPAHGTASGSAVIDAQPVSDPASPHDDSFLVRADGYRILITDKALIVWDPPLHSLIDVKAGDWIHYEGTRRPDGTVAAEKVRLTRIAVSGGEQTFRFKSDYDPSRVPASAKQNVLHKVFLGEDYKNIPPARDPVMQGRVETIGKELIPAFQRNLASTDPAKIDFRFQVTDDPKWREVTPLPSGIILIPRQAIERMKNDSQLAAILASSIAASLERGPFRMRKAVDATTTAAYLAYWPAGVGIGDAANAAARRKQEEQSDRVSLWLMHDAGYDIDQAPIAWWLLASKEPKPISEITLPGRSANLYRILGEVWHNPAASSSQSR